MAKTEPLHFASDYMQGAHPDILQRLVETNMESSAGYGTDEHCERARQLIAQACEAPNAEIHFLVGGTQTNACVIDCMLKPWQGVVSAHTGHVCVHEAGAIEAGGHKVFQVPATLGKLSAAQVEAVASEFEIDGNRDHMVEPAMVYISQPTEYGTIYSLAELEEISATCKAHNLKLFVDGARLAYALAAPENDVQLPDLARLSDAFYIGGTKCGCMFGEAVVLPQAGSIPHFFTLIKQHGALLAKGRLLGVQFEVLFEDGLYQRIGKPAIEAAHIICDGLKAQGVQFFMDTPTNQIFLVIDNAKLDELSQVCDYSYMEKFDDDHTVIRLATCWATTNEQAHQLVDAL